MRVLIACEFSGRVRDAFASRGHVAYSCDLLPSESQPRSQARHLQMDVLKAIRKHGPWDLLIAHPPCQFLSVSGNRWLRGNRERQRKQVEAFEFVMKLALAEVPKIAIEQPASVLSGRWRKPDQVIQPWQFGHPENKKTCLWLKGLPPLKPTKIVRWKMTRRPVHLANRVHHAAPGPERWKERSRTFTGIAAAMADQWGELE